MISPEEKIELAGLLDKADPTCAIKEIIINFLESYDGTYKFELKSFIFVMARAAMLFRQYEIDACTYHEIVAVDTLGISEEEKTERILAIIARYKVMISPATIVAPEWIGNQSEENEEKRTGPNLVSDEEKAGYIELLTKVKPESFDFVEVDAFIRSYDGTNIDDLHILIFTLTLFFAALNEKKIISNGLYKFIEFYDEFAIQREKIFLMHDIAELLFGVQDENQIRAALESHPEILGDKGELVLQELLEEKKPYPRREAARLKRIFHRCRVLGIDRWAENYRRAREFIQSALLPEIQTHRGNFWFHRLIDQAGEALHDLDLQMEITDQFTYIAQARDDDEFSDCYEVAGLALAALFQIGPSGMKCEWLTLSGQPDNPGRDSETPTASKALPPEPAWKELDPENEKVVHSLRNLPEYLFRENKLEQLARAISSPFFIYQKMKILGLQTLLDDYRRSGLHQPIGDVLRQAAHIIGEDYHQLFPQLIGRMRGIDPLLAHALESSTPYNFLSGIYPLTSGFFLHEFSRTFVFEHFATIVNFEPVDGGSQLLVHLGPDRVVVLDVQTGYINHQVLLSQIEHDFQANLTEPVHEGLQARVRNAWHAILASLPALKKSTPETPQPAKINACRYLPGCSRLAIGTSSGRLALYDLNSHWFAKIFSAHEGPVIAVDFFIRAGEEVLLTLGNAGDLCYWNPVTGEMIQTVLLEASPRRMQVCQNEACVLLELDKKLRMWDLIKQHIVFDIPRRIPSSSLLFTTFPGYAVITYEGDFYERSTTIDFWEIHSGKYKGSIRLEDSNDMVLGSLITSSQENSTFLLYGTGHEFIQREMQSIFIADLVHDDTYRFTGHIGCINQLKMSEHSNTLFSSNGSELKVWDVSKGRRKEQNIGAPFKHTKAVIDTAISMDGNLAVSLDSGGLVNLWDTNVLTPTRKIEADEANPVLCCAAHPKGNYAAFGYKSGEVKIWPSNSPDPVYILSQTASPVNDVLFSHDGKQLFSAHQDASIAIWDVSHGCLIGLMNQSRYAVKRLALSKDQTRLAFTTLYTDNPVVSSQQIFNFLNIVVWDLVEDQLLWGQTVTTSSVADLTISEDMAEVLLTPQVDEGKVVIWDLDRLEIAREIRCHSERINGVALIPGTSHLLTVGNDQKIKLIHTRTGDTLSQLSVETYPTCCSVNRNGLAIIGSGSGEVDFVRCTW